MIRHWVAVARPRTLFAAACPVMLGAAVAGRALPGALPWLLATMACAVLLQVAANTANDYWDFRKGADTHRRKGPPRMTAAGIIRPEKMLAATAFAMAAALLLGVLLVWRGGWPVLLIGVAAAVSAIIYTAGPFAIAYLGLGEVFAFVFFGPVAVVGSAYLLTLEWHPSAAILGAAPGGYAVALMGINNLRDREEDSLAEKRTLAVRFGENFAAGILVFALWLPVLACGGLMLIEGGLAPVPAAFAATIAALRLTRRVGGARRSGDWNPLIPATGLAAIAFTTAYLLGAWLL